VHTSTELAARLASAHLAGAILSQASLQEANLSRADLRRTDLRGADLSNANLEDAMLAEAQADDTTIWATDLGAGHRRELRITEAGGDSPAQVQEDQADAARSRSPLWYLTRRGRASKPDSRFAHRGTQLQRRPEASQR
jgi:hypothetical protein